MSSKGESINVKDKLWMATASRVPCNRCRREVHAVEWKNRRGQTMDSEGAMFFAMPVVVCNECLGEGLNLEETDAIALSAVPS